MAKKFWLFIKRYSFLIKYIQIDWSFLYIILQYSYSP